MLALVVPAVVAAACAVPSAGTGTVPPGTPILTVTAEGGFAPVVYLLNRGPRYVLMADGRLFAAGPSPAIHPGPMVPPYVVARVDAETMGEIRAAVEEIGFPRFDELRDTEAADRVADATTEVVTYRDAAGSHVFAVYALGIGDQTDPRVTRLADLLALLDDAASGDAEPMVVDRLVVHVVAGSPDPEFPDVRPWPLPRRPDELTVDSATGWACAVYDGEDATALLAVFSPATRATVWQLGGSTYRILARPLLPGETGCS